MRVDWEGIAVHLDFSSATEMLEYFYLREKKSVRQISEILNVSGPSVSKELVRRDIEIRNEKGRIPGEFQCRHCGGIFEGDIRNICCSNPDCQAKEDEAIRKVKYAITRRRFNRGTNNPCKICGKDKGANRWYCKECQGMLSIGSMFDDF